MIAAVDTNILLDVLGKAPKYWQSSSQLLRDCSSTGALVISPVVYSELLVFFLRKMPQQKAINALDEFLKDMDIQIVVFNHEDFVLSAKSWLHFLSTKEVMCPKCGARSGFICPKCSSQILWRNHVIADFLIGAHAENHSEILLTRDRAYYKKYFKIKTLP